MDVTQEPMCGRCTEELTEARGGAGGVAGLCVLGAVCTQRSKHMRFSRDHTSEGGPQGREVSTEGLLSPRQETAGRGEAAEEKEPHSLLVETYTGTVAVETAMEFPGK